MVSRFSLVASAASRFRLLQNEDPSRLFWLVAGAHLLLWTLLPILVHGNAPLDVIEGQAWGREWLLGYPKGPPLFAWILGAIDAVPPPFRLWLTFLLSQICIFVTFFGVWRLALRLLPARDALVAILLMEGIYFIGFPTPELNEIVLQMPISALLGWVFHRAISDGKSRDWLLVGVLAALGMWTRYSAAMLLLSLALYLVISPARRWLRHPGPYLSLAVLTVLWAPHLWWMHRAAGQSVHYVGDRAPHLANGLAYLVQPLRFTGAQLLALLPALLLVAILVVPKRPAPPRFVAPLDRPSFLYVACIGLGPFLFAQVLATASGLGLRSMWGAPLWCFFGLLLVAAFRHRFSAQRRPLFVAAWCATIVLPLVIFAAMHVLRPIVAQERRSSFPGQQFAGLVTEHWHRVTADRLSYVIGDLWLSGNLAYYSGDRPSAFIDADIAASPWIDVTDLKAKGAILVWDAGATGTGLPPSFAATFPDAVAQESLLLHKRCFFCAKTVEVGWAILPPRNLANKWASKAERSD